MSKSSSRLSLSAHYTSYVWLKHGLSYPQLSTLSGRLIHLLLSPINGFFKLKGGANIDTFLLQRHKIINHELKKLIEEKGVTQVLELGSGLSPRGLYMASAYPHIQYVETDLEDMIKHKAQRLKKLNPPSNLNLKACSFIAFNNQPSIADRLEELSPNQPTVIVSEGLINYFSTEDFNQALKNISAALKPFKASHYLSDLYPDDINHPSYKYLKMAQSLVSKLTGNTWFLHYQNNDEIAKAFKEAGFLSTQVINPKNLYKTGVVEAIKAEPLVRIVLGQNH